MNLPAKLLTTIKEVRTGNWAVNISEDHKGRYWVSSVSKGKPTRQQFNDYLIASAVFDSLMDSFLETH